MATETATTELRTRTAWVRNLATPVRDYLNNETGGALVMVGAAAVALLWANLSISSYESFWTTKFSIGLGDSSLSLDLRHFVNQGLMTFFFLVVGLEAKRELDRGELRERRRITLPAMAAIGGMVVPVLVYLAVNAGGDSAHGWGAAMSTDTAFVLGLLAVIAPGGTRLRVTLLTFAIVDDLTALLVISTVYTESVEIVPLAVALALFALLLALRFVPMAWRSGLALLFGVGIWGALLQSGIDPVVTGLAVGLVTTAFPAQRTDLERVTTLTRLFREQPTPAMARSAQIGLESAVPANDRLQYRLHPWTSFVIVPLFAIANIGVHIDGDLLSDAVTSPITLGIALGYIVGKPIGVLGSVWFGSRVLGLRRALTWPVVWLASTVTGIGFTVSLLVASIAFEGQDLDEARLGVLVAAIVATAAGFVVSRVIQRLPQEVRARQIAQTREDIPDLVDEVNPERDHIRGSDEALVTLLEYGDYECPYCGQAEVTIRELLQSFSDDLRYVWRHLPLNDVHQHAELAAEAAEAAAAQGAFWEMHDKLLDHQDELEPRHLTDYATELGLDVDRFWDDVRERAHASRIAEDVSTADASGVTGTPSFFINGRRHEGAYDIESLTAAVRAARWRADLLQSAPER
jgi:Na+/H+ antiporter NhaA